jgi:hypothetical protein
MGSLSQPDQSRLTAALRYLRIGWSLVWGIAFEVSLVAWIGSYFKHFIWGWRGHLFIFFEGTVVYGRPMEAALPVWALVAITAAAAAAPWIRWRFSLSTLIFGTTLIAVVLGTIMYALRS